MLKDEANHCFSWAWVYILRAAAIAGLTFVILSNAAIAQSPTIAANPDGTVTWQAGVNGVAIDLDANGRVSRIYSKYSHPVTIPDRRGIRTATVIAEEKAKGEIVRFLEQDVATGRVVSEVEATLSETIQQNSGTAESVSSVDQRAVTESLTELSSSFSTGTLRGVVVLESGYDKEAQEAWVVVGVSEKTLKAAGAAKGMIESTEEPAGAEQVVGGDAGEAQEQEGVPSQVRRSNSDF